MILSRHSHPSNGPSDFKRKSMKTLIYTLLMLVCRCRLAVESSHSTLIGAEKVSAIVEAYKAVWHSFYDEENFKEINVSFKERRKNDSYVLKVNMLIVGTNVSVTCCFFV